jgi:hypothetical protein
VEKMVGVKKRQGQYEVGLLYRSPYHSSHEAETNKFLARQNWARSIWKLESLFRMETKELHEKNNVEHTAVMATSLTFLRMQTWIQLAHIFKKHLSQQKNIYMASPTFETGITSRGDTSAMRASELRSHMWFLEANFEFETKASPYGYACPDFDHAFSNMRIICQVKELPGVGLYMCAVGGLCAQSLETY